MKHGYVSLVLSCSAAPSEETLARLDNALASQARSHEIVVVTPYGEPNSYAGLATVGPVTTVMTHMRATADGLLVAGLGRAVGDFVIEWRGSPDPLDEALLSQILAPTDTGTELVEVVGTETSMASRAFQRLVNQLRPSVAPLRKTIARVFSRRALQEVLGATAFEPQLDVLTAELPVHRSTVRVSEPNPHQDSWAQRFSDGLALLSKGTRFGSAVPISLAIASALFGTGAALYALAILILRGQAPEGWTTLMVVIGLGQAAVLTMLGLTWARLDALTRGLSRNTDATAEVQVLPPKRMGADETLRVSAEERPGLSRGSDR